MRGNKSYMFFFSYGKRFVLELLELEFEKTMTLHHSFNEGTPNLLANSPEKVKFDALIESGNGFQLRGKNSKKGKRAWNKFLDSLKL